MSENQLKSEYFKISIDDLRSLIFDALLKEQYTEQEANVITETLMYAELRGNNQGVMKLISGGLKKDMNSTSIRTIYETPVSCQLSGGSCQGMVVISYAVDIAVQKASKTGISVVGVNEYASATGAIGHWSYKMAQHGFISIVMSQCPEMVAPHGSYEPIYGTNPIAMGIPLQYVPKEYENATSADNLSAASTVETAGIDGENGMKRPSAAFPEAIVLDMATSAFAWYGLVAAKEANETIPSDIAYDNQGQSTTDPSAAMLGGALRSFDRSYKGSHLALMVELLAGAFTGASMTNKTASKNWGTLLICIDPNILGDRDGFVTRAKEMGQRVQRAKLLPNNSDKSVKSVVDKNGGSSTDNSSSQLYLPGQRGDEKCAQNMKNGTVTIKTSVYESLVSMGK